MVRQERSTVLALPMILNLSSRKFLKRTPLLRLTYRPTLFHEETDSVNLFHRMPICVENVFTSYKGAGQRATLFYGSRVTVALV